MFKYSFEQTGAHPSLATKMSQIVINRDDLASNFQALVGGVPQVESAQSATL